MCHLLPHRPGRRAADWPRLGCGLFFFAGALLQAEETRPWTQTRMEAFEKGTAQGVSIRSDGKLLLAPRVEELFEAPASYLWTLLTDSQGNLFAGGGPGARVFRIGKDGRKATFFETDAIEIHAIAIDRQDNVYAATSPDTKIYKIDPSGAYSVFIDLDAEYVWSMAFGSNGDLFVATGDKGRIYRVTPAGEGSVFLETEETHVRSIVVDSADNLIVGSDPSGLILRISTQADTEPRAFVLHQSSKKEITALALGDGGTIYAAGVGQRKTAPPPQLISTAGPAITRAAPPTLSPSVIPVNPQTAAAGSLLLPRPPSAVGTRVTGGSQVYRISPAGEPRTVWQSSSDIVYALTVGADDHLLIGTGDRGRLLRLESETLYSLVLTAPSSQITAFAAAPDGRVFAATSNIAKIYALGPGLEREGRFESDVFDARIFSSWGRLEWRGETPSGTRAAVSTRSGNLQSPARNWSEWSEPIRSPEGAPSGSPASRFVQWRAVLTGGDDGASPLLDAVTLYYLPKNVAPLITAIEATPPNYEFSRPAVQAAASNLTLAPLGGPPRPRVTAKPSPGQAMRSAEGKVGVRWLAKDENDDALVFKVEIRGEGEQSWKLLEEKVDDPFLDWDSTSFADGRYRVRVTASDSPSNPSSEAETFSKVSDPFVIDNTAPSIQGLSAQPEGGRLDVRFEATDTTTVISKAEYSLDGQDWEPILPQSRLFDSQELSFDFQTGPVEGGEHTVAVRVYDAHENVATSKAVVR